MSPLTRRRLLGLIPAAWAWASAWQPVRAASSAAQPARVVDMEARRFRFTPDEISIKAGEHVVLAVHSLDFIHGLSLPSLGLRADLLPGQVTRITLPLLPAGKVDFLCDNFCGDEHETMHGQLLITP
jgi:cytochrome c oxidase subunit 2